MNHQEEINRLQEKIDRLNKKIELSRLEIKYYEFLHKAKAWYEFGEECKNELKGVKG